LVAHVTLVAFTALHARNESAGINGQCLAASCSMDSEPDLHDALIGRLHRIAELRRAAVLDEDWAAAQGLAREFFDTLEQLIRLGHRIPANAALANTHPGPGTLQ
jgi:hypothetical protein